MTPVTTAANVSAVIPDLIGDGSAPRRHRFVRELVAVPCSDGLIIDGTARLQIMRGEVARELLPRLIPLMNGRLTEDELANALPEFPALSIHAALMFLVEAGLAEETLTDEPDTNLQTLGFFRRFLSATRWNSSGLEAWGKLSSAGIVIVDAGGPSEAARCLEDLLLSTGVGAVRVAGRSSLDSWAPGGAGEIGCDLVVSMSSGDEEHEWYTGLDRWCFQHRVSWFRATVNESAGYADLGPFFKAGESVCYDCFRRVHTREATAARSPGEPDCSAVEFWAGMVAAEIVYLLTRIGPLITGRGLRRYDLRSWEAKDLVCPRIPGCPRCRPLTQNVIDAPGEPGASGLIDTALVFDDYVGLPSRTINDPRAEQESKRIGQGLSRHAKRFAVCREYSLPAAPLDLEGSVFAALHGEVRAGNGPLTIGKLSTVLQMTAGIRAMPKDKGVIERWAATAGNLGSVEVYVAVRSVDGLLPGLYLYQPQEHSLASLDWRGGGLEIDDFVGRATFSDSKSLPDVLVILTGALHRVARKYGAFGYRLINEDAGAAASQLHLVANTLGLFSRALNLWADDLIEAQLHLDGKGEQCTACVALSCEPAESIEPGPSESRCAERNTTSLMPASHFHEFTAEAVLEKLYRDSRISEPRVAASAFILPPGMPHGRSPVVPLPKKAVCKGMTVGATLAGRKSVRAWAREPATIEQLSTMLWCGDNGDARDWPEETRFGNPLAFLVLARRIAGLAPSVYAYTSSGHGLLRERSLLQPQENVELLVQSELASAPLQIWVIGDLAASCARHGAWGHRQLLLRAGAAAHRLWFAALGQGIGGTIAAGLVSGAARTHLGLDGYRRAGLCTVAVGPVARHLQP